MATLTTPIPAAFLAQHSPSSFYSPGMSEAEFLALFDEFPDCFLEYTADGTVIIMPLSDPKTSAVVSRVGRLLGNWAEDHGRGIVSGPDGLFFFPNGARRGPDAAWFDRVRWEAVQDPKTRYPMFAPDFVIEVRSPERRARPLREKMAEYIENGVKLGWLIDPIERTVTIYRRDRDPEVLANPKSVSGEGPVEGFVLNLQRILD